MRTRVRVFVCLGLIVVGILIFLVGLFGVGRMSEDACLNFANEHDYGGARSTGKLFPPTFGCVLSPSDPASFSPQTVVTLHFLTAVARVVIIGFPLFWLSGVASVALWRPRRRPPADPRDENSSVDMGR